MVRTVNSYIGIAFLLILGGGAAFLIYHLGTSDTTNFTQNDSREGLRDLEQSILNK